MEREDRDRKWWIALGVAFAVLVAFGFAMCVVSAALLVRRLL